MKFSKINIIYSSHLDYIHDSRFELNVKNTVGCKHNIFRYENKNQFSLTEIYNQALDEHTEDDAILVFCHNDISFDTKNWGVNLLNKFNNSKYDIIGVAGTDLLLESGVWWGSRPNMFGIVNHENPFRKWTTEFSNPIKGIKDVVVLDGLFFGVNPHTIETKFDTDFKGFHFYEISFCMSNYIAGCNIGITTDIRLTHRSVGITNSEWEQNRLLFIEKYKDELPVKFTENE